MYVNYYKHHRRSFADATEYKINVLVDGQQQDFSGTLSSRDAKRLVHEFRIEPTLQFAAPAFIELEQAGECIFSVILERSRFSGPVEVELVDPDQELSLSPVLLPAGANEAEVKLTAGGQSKVGKRGIRLVAHSGDVSAECEVQVDVLARPATLAMSLPSAVQ